MTSSKAGGDLALKQTSLLFSFKCQLVSIYKNNLICVIKIARFVSKQAHLQPHCHSKARSLSRRLQNGLFQRPISRDDPIGMQCSVAWKTMPEETIFLSISIWLVVIYSPGEHLTNMIAQVPFRLATLTTLFIEIPGVPISGTDCNNNNNNREMG